MRRRFRPSVIKSEDASHYFSSSDDIPDDGTGTSRNSIKTKPVFRRGLAATDLLRMMQTWAGWALDTARRRGATYADVRVMDIRQRELHGCFASIPDIKRDHQAIRRHMEDSNFEKFVRAQVYNVANRSVATMAAIRLVLRDKKLLIRVATNTKIAETPMFAKFKYDQSTVAFWLRFIIVDEDALHASLVAARSSSSDE